MQKNSRTMILSKILELPISTRRDSNPRPSPWQGDTPPLSHSCSLFYIYTVLTVKHETGFEPATLALARRYSTAEPLVQSLYIYTVLTVKHETGFEPATLALARRYSTAEPLVHRNRLVYLADLTGRP